MGTGIRDYLRAFNTDWLTLMSSIPSVPLSVAALFVHPTTLRLLFGTMAVFCFVFASYRVWRIEREKNLEPGPDVVLDYSHGDNGLTVRNLDGGIAYRVRVEEVHAGTLTARFPEEAHYIKEKDSWTFFPTLSRNNAGFSPMLQSDFKQVITEVENQAQSLQQAIDPEPIQIVVSYADNRERRFTSEWEIKARPVFNEAIVRFKGRKRMLAN